MKEMQPPEQPPESRNPYVEGPPLAEDLLNGRLPVSAASVALWLAQYDLKRKGLTAAEVRGLGEKAHKIFVAEGHLDQSKTANALLGPRPIPPYSGEGLWEFWDWLDKISFDSQHTLAELAAKLGEVFNLSLMLWFGLHGQPGDDTPRRRALRRDDLLPEATAAILTMGFRLYAIRENEMAVKYYEALAAQQAAERSALTNLARKGAEGRQREHRAMKDHVFGWCEAHLSKYRSMDAAAEAIAGKEVSVTFRTARDWISQYKESKKVRSAGKP